MSFMGPFLGWWRSGTNNQSLHIAFCCFVSLDSFNLKPPDVSFHVIYISQSPDFWKSTWQDGYFLSVVNLLFLDLGSGFPMALAFYIFFITVYLPKKISSYLFHSVLRTYKDFILWFF